MGQASGHSIEYSAQYILWPIMGCQSGLGSHLRLEVFLQVHVVVGRIHFPSAVELRAARSFNPAASHLTPVKELSWLGQAHPGWSPFWFSQINQLGTLVSLAESLTIGFVSQHILRPCPLSGREDYNREQQEPGILGPLTILPSSEGNG